MFSEYTTLHRDYETAKANYLQFKSLVAERDAFEKTKRVLLGRGKALQTYFSLLQEKINETQGIERKDFDNVSAKIESKIEFLESHKVKLEGAQNITQLEDLTKEFEAKRKEFQDLSEEATSLVILGQLSSGFKSHQALQQKITILIQEKPESIKDKALVERWIGESEKDAQASLLKQNEASQLLDQFIAKSGQDTSEILPKLEARLKVAKDHLVKAVSAQEQMARRIEQ